MRRSVGVVAVVFGLALVAGCLLGGAFGKARNGERLLDGARPTMRNGVAQLRSDTDTLRRGIEETVDGVEPRLARELGLSDAEFLAQVRQNYPAQDVLFSRRAEVTGALEKTVANLEAHADEFRAADDLPAPGVSLEVLPIVALAAGAIFVVAGVFVLRRPSCSSSSPALWVVAGLALVLVGSAMALRIPQKSAAAESVVDSLDITHETAQRTRAQFDAVQAALDEQREVFFPDVARALGVSTEALLADIAQQFPDAAKGLREIDGILARIDADVRFREQNVDEFASVRDLPMGAAAWLFVAGAAALLALATTTLLVSPSRRGVDSASYRMSIDARQQVGAR